MTPRSFADRLGDAQIYRLTGLCDWLIAVAFLSGIPRRFLVVLEEIHHGTAFDLSCIVHPVRALSLMGVDVRQGILLERYVMDGTETWARVSLGPNSSEWCRLPLSAADLEEIAGCLEVAS